MQPIDIIIPWVDGADPLWQTEFKKYSTDNQKGIDLRFERYRDWDLLRYWFRGVEEYAPWVRKIHFITHGHLPNWLNTSNKKLNIVKHSDYIDSKYLPVFSSHPIEITIHKITDLSENFIYFNDDFFIINPVQPKDFFTNGLPNDMAILNTISATDKMMPHILTNDLYLINQSFSKKNIYKSLSKWFSLSYRQEILRTLLLSPWPNFTGFYDHHLPQPFLKQTFIDVWNKYGDELQNTMRSRFRATTDVNQYLFRYWQLCTNNFHPVNTKKLGLYSQLSDNNYTSIVNTIKTTNKKIIVLNDSEIENFELIQSEVIKAFIEKLPNKSSFEV